MKKFIFFLFTYLTFIPSLQAQATWKQYQGPYMGNILSFTTKGDTLFAGSDLSGLFYSVDYGLSWQAGGIKGNNITALQAFGTKLFAGLNDIPFVSENNGFDWRAYPSLGGAIEQFYIFADKLFAATDVGIYIYDSLSDSWIEKNEGFLPDSIYNVRHAQCFVNLGELLFCGTITNGLFSSRDSGESWTKIPDPSDISFSTILCMINFKDTLVIFPNNIDRRIYYSADTGRNWVPIDFIRNDVSYLGAFNFDDTLIVLTNKGLYSYNWNNASWNILSDESFEKMYVNDSILIASNAFGLFRYTTSDRKFVLSNKGLNTARVYDMVEANKTLYCATTSGSFYTIDDGLNWELIPGTKNLYCHTISVKDSLVFIGSGQGIIAGSREGSNWHHLDEGLKSKVIWDIDVLDSMILAATDSGLFKSLDNGQNWYEVQQGSTQFLKIAHGNGMILTGNLSGLFSLSSGGDSLNLVGFNDGGIQTFEIIGSEVYVSKAMGGIYKSIDSCKSWMPVYVPDLYPPVIYDIFKRGDNNIYASGTQYIYYSPDLGATWNTWSEEGMPDLYIERVLQSDSCLYAATFGKSIWKREYLKLTNLSSNKYSIVDSSFINIPENTSVDSLRSNLILAHGASAQVIVNSKSGTTILHSGDLVKIIAEDGVTTKTYSIQSVNGFNKTKSTDIRIYPTLAHDRIYIMHAEEIKAVFIYNLTGELLSKSNINGDYMDISNIPEGMYIMTLSKWDNEMISLKFIKY